MTNKACFSDKFRSSLHLKRKRKRRRFWSKKGWIHKHIYALRRTFTPQKVSEKYDVERLKGIWFQSKISIVLKNI